MPHHRSSRWMYYLPVATILILMTVAPVHAFPISTCGVTCATDCNLAADIVCDENTPFAVTLTNGADLDLAGHNLICFYAEGDDTSCGTAVLGSPNSMIWTSTPRDTQHRGARIEGNWRVGANCGGGSGTRVTGIELRGGFRGNNGAAVKGCQTVDGNTVVGVPGLSYGGGVDGTVSLVDAPYGILLRNGAGSNIVSQNYVDGFGSGIIRLGASVGTTTIDSNTINVREKPPSATPKAGINLVTVPYSPATVTNNIFTGDVATSSLIATNSAHPSFNYSNNICKHTMPACAACIAAGKCQASGICVSP